MTSRLRQLALPLTLAAALALLGGCASTPEVYVNVDVTANFAQYKTFAFASPLGTDRGGYQSIVSQYLKAATQREMEARGLRLDDAAPQLLVNFNGQLSEKIRVSSVPGPYYGIGYGRGYYGYRAGMYGAWPMYDQTLVSQYTEGTLNIDVVDAARKQLVWEGVVTNSVTQKDLDNLGPAIDTAVVAAFAKYPVAAAKAK
jgi:hypothetical protein